LQFIFRFSDGNPGKAVSRLLTTGRLIDAVSIPSSVAAMLRLYLLTAGRMRDIIALLESEMVFFFLKHVLEKHFGKVYLLVGKVRPAYSGVVISIRKVVSETGHHYVKGFAAVDAVHALLVVVLEIVTSYAVPPVPSGSAVRSVDSGIALYNESGNLLVKYFAYV